MVHHNAQAGGVVLSRLSKSYGRVRAVRSIDLTIAPGETVALREVFGLRDLCIRRLPITSRISYVEMT